MAILMDTDSEEAKERRKFEQFPSAFGPPGNPYQLRPYPAMMYRAQRIPPGLPGAGKFATGVAKPSKHGFRNTDEWDAACQEVEMFARSCQRIVGNDAEFKRAAAEGWAETSPGAIDRAEKEWRSIGETAAHRNYEDRNMSDAAKAEAAEAEAEHFGHLGEVPEKPKRKRARSAVGTMAD